MQISEILFPELCLLGEQATSRKKALQILAQSLQQHDNALDDFEVLKALITREQLGSTAIGNGVALPHARTADCQKPVGALLSLEEGVDFSAPDQEVVDLMFCLLVPENYDFQKLGGLNQIVELFQDKVLRAQIRNAHNGQALYDIMLGALEMCDSVELKENAPNNETNHS
ncbi:PTS sugar transporter subunit IIA [Kangiella sp. HZ709]|uniref:PTS sugar transporter subunit IIA n=1 Tax=Kangiella sp. HZ709 TaxID=2666328 RepID=UPI0012AEE81A|nr:PTS sugar transporter subunit IIA [Kangiella sp. HZ709]MRX27474.1 transcriptional regulator [Kangiella sp. HZ709]